MNLSDIFPKESISKKFNSEISIQERGRKNLNEIANLKTGCMVEIGGGAWDRYVQQNPSCDPRALGSFFDDGSPKLYLAMERLTGLKVLKDILYTTAHVIDESLEDTLCAELLLAVTWPNVLRISDVTFINPYGPIPETERQYHYQDYKGLGLFPELLENCEKFCSENDIPEITLSAAYIDLVPFFESYGFMVEDTPAGRAYLELEAGIPMHKVLKNA
ncbi:hypothetical protein [Saccharospirillum mangrovi]|uniref:hypothetical protein n=1 Tax=Saccharospirillum mangrovi TaxID=2161747 RepID=UPI000D353E64|nr:hypothetical protein [Saccharospirillum mangrovi]